MCLNGKLASSVAIEVDVAEMQDKITILTADRFRLVTTVEVVEADIKCLSVELRRAESQAKKRRSSAGDNLLAEMSAVETSCALLSETVCVTIGTNTEFFTSDPPCSSSAGDQNESRDKFMIEDSHLRYAGKDCVNKGVYLECLPGAKIIDIKNRLLSFVDR